MFIILFDRGDRLGANIFCYLAQIMLAHHNNYLIQFEKHKNEYRFYHSIFVQELFEYMETRNKKLVENGMTYDTRFIFENQGDFIQNITCAMQMMKIDYFTFYANFIKQNDMAKKRVVYSSQPLPFDVDKTILVHLRLDDTVNYRDYNGTSCSNFFRKKLMNGETCRDNALTDGSNCQAPLSKRKLENIIHRAVCAYPGRQVYLLSSPCSDTSFLPYPVIKSDDESYDMYLLTMCKVLILSRSTFALAGLLFNEGGYEKVYIPMWGHAVCIGIDSIFSQMDVSKMEFFA